MARGDRPFGHMATPGSSQQGDEARAYAAVRGILTDLDSERSAFDRPHEAYREATYATMRAMPTLEVLPRRDIEARRRARQYERAD